MSTKRVVPPSIAPSSGLSDLNPEWFRGLASEGHDLFFRYRLLPTPGYDYLSPSVTEPGAARARGG